MVILLSALFAMGRTSHLRPPWRRPSRPIPPSPKSSISKSGNVRHRTNSSLIEEKPSSSSAKDETSPSSVPSPEFNILSIFDASTAFSKNINIIAEFGPADGVTLYSGGGELKAKIQTKTTAPDGDLPRFEAKATKILRGETDDSYYLKFDFENVKFEYMEGKAGVDIRVVHGKKEIFRELQESS